MLSQCVVVLFFPRLDLTYVFNTFINKLFINESLHISHKVLVGKILFERRPLWFAFQLLFAHELPVPLGWHNCLHPHISRWQPEKHSTKCEKRISRKVFTFSMFIYFCISILVWHKTISLDSNQIVPGR